MKPTDIPSGHRPHPVLDTGITLDLPIGTVLVDCDGDEWTVTGRTRAGDVLVDCPAPRNPEDAGTGPSRRWTLVEAERWFGPLAPRMVRAEDVEESALAEVDVEFHDMYGPDSLSWQPWQVEQYLAAVQRVHAGFSPLGVAA